MVAPNVEGTPSARPLEPRRQSGIRSVLEFTGIPSSWFSKRPKLPSRNWLIFLTFTSSLTGLYVYDRRQCKRIRREYVDRVKHLADEPIDSMDWLRKVTVYGSKWPGDEEYDRSMKYFRKYVKPIFVAAAIDYEMVNGRRHGDLATRIADDIKSRRRIAVGLDKPPVSPMPLPTAKSPEETRKHELDGGIVIVGRQTLKEFLAGLKRGWTEGLEKVDKDEQLARELEADGHFDEPDEIFPDEEGGARRDATAPPSRFPSPKNQVVYSPLQAIRQQPVAIARSTHGSSPVPPSLDAPPPSIPLLPPLLLVSFTNFIGFTQIPLMIWDFFNQRHKYRAGAEAAYMLVKKDSRPFEAPITAETATSDLGGVVPPPPANIYHSDLDFDKNAESYYKKSFASIPAEIEKAREKYYEALPAKLETARAIARNTREMTKDEQAFPPPTEVELRAERMNKEKRWRSDLEGWAIVNPEQEAVWDERFREALRVFIDSSSDK